MSPDRHPAPDPAEGPGSDTGQTARAPGETVQLRLLPSGAHPEWRLDERTRTVGRRGVAQAREILRRAHPPRPEGRKAS